MGSRSRNPKNILCDRTLGGQGVAEAKSCSKTMLQLMLKIRRGKGSRTQKLLKLDFVTRTQKFSKPHFVTHAGNPTNFRNAEAEFFAPRGPTKTRRSTQGQLDNPSPKTNATKVRPSADHVRARATQVFIGLGTIPLWVSEWVSE